MQVTVEDKSTVKKIIHVEIPEEDVAHELDEAYKTLKKTAKIKGFRPGKAPRSVLEGMYKKDVNADVTARLIQNSFMDALKETELNIIGQPKVDPPELDVKGPYKYDATVEIKPEIGDVEFKGLNLKKTLYRVTDGEVDAQLEMLRKNQSRMDKIEEGRAVREGDFAVIDYEGFKDGESFDKTEKTENYTLKVGAGYITEDFDKQLEGMKPGETKQIDVSFPEDHSDKDLANLDIQFQVNLREIRQEVLPDLDEQFAKKFGPYESIDDLKEEISKNLQQGYDKRIEHELNEQIFKALIAQQDFELPEIMVEYELEGIMAEAERSFSMNNITLEQVGLTKEIMKEKYLETAENQVRRHLILSKLIGQESLDISDEELEEGFAEMAVAINQPEEKIKELYQENNERMEVFKNSLLEKKSIRLIIGQGNIEEVEPALVEESENVTDKTKSIYC